MAARIEWLASTPIKGPPIVTESKLMDGRLVGGENAAPDAGWTSETASRRQGFTINEFGETSGDVRNKERLTWMDAFWVSTPV